MEGQDLYHDHKEDGNWKMQFFLQPFVFSVFFFFVKLFDLKYGNNFQTATFAYIKEMKATYKFT